MKLNICGKEYVVPELTFEHVELMETETGISVYDLINGNHALSAARVFVQVVTGASASEAKALMNEHIMRDGHAALYDVVDKFADAATDSDFFCKLLGLPTKSEREAAAAAAEKSSPVEM